jgi:hypothetical protein
MLPAQPPQTPFANDASIHFSPHRGNALQRDPHSSYPLTKPLQACSVENRLEDLKSMLQRLELCQKSLNEYLVSQNASYTTLSRKLEHA